MDPFSTLGVARDASAEDIKDAFRKAALQWHPDRHVGGGAAVQALAAQRFSEISRAYEVLTDPSRRRNGGEWRQRQERARPSEGWRERSAYTGAQSTAGSGPYEWRHANMDGTRAAAEEVPWTFRRFSRGLGGVAAGALILVFLTVKSPLEWLTGSKARPRPAAADEDVGSSAGRRAAALAGHRPSPERLSHSAAHALGLPYKPAKLPQRSAAQLRWSATHARSAAEAADAAEAASQRAAASAAAASDAAARARAAAQRAAGAEAPGEIAAADAAARSAQSHAARNEAAAEYAAALAIVASGPRVELTPEIVYGASTHSRRTSESGEQRAEQQA